MTEVCAVSPRADGLHFWKFDGDDPRVICVFCGEVRDALSGRVISAGADGDPSRPGTPEEPDAAKVARQRFRQAVRDAATYSSDDGTCGWLLSEEQFTVIDGAGEDFAARMVEAYAHPPYPPRQKRQRRETGLEHVVSDDLSLALPFDSDEPEFRRGVEIGMLWSDIEHMGCAEATVHADCAEMLMRIAEAKGLRFSADAIDENWLHVVIGGAS